MERYEQYKKTIIWCLEKYHDYLPFSFDDGLINDLAMFLKIDISDIKNALACTEGISVNNQEQYYFGILIRAFFAKQELDNIIQEGFVDDQNMHILLSHLYLCQHHMTMLNADISTYMCILHNTLTWEYAVQDWSGYGSGNVLDFLQMLDCYECLEGNLSEINCMVASITYDMATRINTIYLLGVLLIIENSPFVDDEIKNISKDLYLYLIKTFKNSRLVGLRINSRPVLMSDMPSERGRLSNTTRIMIVYSYDNYDAYCLRLDLPHKGIEFIHYNNRSPGDGNGTEVESCVYSEEDYQKVLKEHNDIFRLKDFFIEYSGIFALKERSNCEFLDDREKQVFDKLEEEHSHAFISKNQYAEEKIEEFAQILSCFLAPSCLQPIDADYEFARNCFNRNMLMFELHTLIISGINSSSESIIPQRLIDTIIERAIRYRLLNCNESEKGEWKNIYGVHLVVGDILKEMPKIL